MIAHRLAPVALLLVAATAAAEEHRKVVVLEYRAGVHAAPGIGMRLADRLKKTAALTVIDAEEARRRYPRVDAELGKCGGESECVARLGVAVDAEEVLLVGLSQLGDLVLALQRIDVEGTKVRAQHTEVLPIAGEVADTRLDAWLHKLYPAETFKRYGSITVICNVDGARVTFNEMPQGETPLNAVRVLAGKSYRVTLEKSGYLPFHAGIDVVPDAKVEVRAELSPEAPTVPWYKRWYVWAVVGGVVAGAGIGTAAYLARPDQTHDAGFIVLPPK
jgi:hypothetical protein